MKKTVVMDRTQLRFALDVAETLTGLKKGTPDYGGEYYVARAPIYYDGDETGISVEADEFGGYSIVAEFEIEDEAE